MTNAIPQLLPAQTITWSASERHARRGDGGRLRVAIVGGGIAGVSAALELLRLGAEIVIIEDRPADQTVSVMAAGLIEPVAGTRDPEGQAIEMAAFARSMKAWRELAANGSSFITRRHVLTVSAGPRPALPWADEVEDFQLVPTRAIHPDYADGEAASFATYVVETYGLLMSARLRLAFNGVRFVRHHLGSLAEVQSVVGPVDGIINASGLGAARLANDPTVFRGDGHVIRVLPVPGVDQVFMDETRPPGDPLSVNMLYIIPRRYDIVIGGTLWDNHDVDSEPKPIGEMPAHLLHLATRIEPRLKHAQIIRYRVGSRPRRKAGVRIEIDPDGSPPTVHCYGQGGSGWTLAPGLAEQAVELLLGTHAARLAS